MSEDLLPPPERRGTRNPFSRKRAERENFPNLDLVFGSTPEHETENIDHSLCSYEGSSILNMSIGARAALNEHMRNVARFGIDGEKVAETSEQFPKSILDEQWECFLEETSKVNTSESFARVSSYPRLDSLILDPSRMEASIEVMTDVSHQDFFNSSRVNMLATPERNFSRINHVVSRDEVEQLMPYEDSYDQVSQAGSYNQGLHEFKVSEHSISEKDSSFHSFCVADISRISNADSEVRRSPNSSFHDHPPTIDDGGYSPILDVASTSNYQDSSFASSTPRRPPPRQNDSTPILPLNFSSTNKKSVLKPRDDKENDGSSLNRSIDPSDTSLSGSLRAAKETISQVAAAACSHLKKQSPPDFFEKGKSVISAIESMPAEILSAVENLRSEVPSPISKRSSQEEGSHREGSSRNSNNEASTSSSSNNSLTGRKLYRTVVPRRVYMENSSPSDFPEEHDSFSSPQSTTEESRRDPTQRSLLESFEAAYQW